MTGCAGIPEDDTELVEPLSVVADTGGERLDVFVSRICSVTRSQARRIIDSGDVVCDSTAAKAGMRLRAGDTVQVYLRSPENVEIVPEDIPLDIVYEDADIAVINKSKGMVVHPAPGNRSGTLVNAVMFHIKDLSGIGGELRPGIVHRLDKLTSGLIVIAKNDAAHASLSDQFKEHSARRTYLAIVEGNLREDCGSIDAPIGRHAVDRKRMAVTQSGRSARTHWRVMARSGSYTLLAVRLETGRTHQIRVHMAYIKHPVAGDAVYGGAASRLGLDGQALHGARLELTHPRTGERMLFYAPLPEWFTAAAKKAGIEVGADIKAALDAVLCEWES